MVESYRISGPLDHLHLAVRRPEHAQLTLNVGAARDLVILRGDSSRRSFAKISEEVIGVGLPRSPNTVSSHRAVSVLWLGPDEWLLSLPAGRSARLLAELDGRLEKEHFLASDISHARTRIELSGARSRDVLGKGCALDLHPEVFAKGQCAQSLLARVQMLLHQCGDEPSYDIYVGRSYAEYAWRWLVDAASEYS